MSEWLPIKSAPKLARVLVAGWQNPAPPMRGWWWYYEDHTDEDGKPMEWPDALVWQPWPSPPTTPPKP